MHTHTRRKDAHVAKGEAGTCHKIRAWPDLSSDVVATVPCGAPVDVIGEAHVAKAPKGENGGAEGKGQGPAEDSLVRRFKVKTPEQGIGWVTAANFEPAKTYQATMHFVAKGME